jgi:parallel beta-helix repeat protein
VIRENSIRDSYVGVDLSSAQNNVVANNTITATTYAVGASYAPGNQIVNNTLDDSWVAVEVDGNASELAFHSNNIGHTRTGVGFEAEGADSPVDALRNWWGCPDGPDNPACADAIGPVDYDPWLTEPNPAAGAG